MLGVPGTAVNVTAAPSEQRVPPLSVTLGTPPSAPPIKSSSEAVIDCDERVSNKTVEKHGEIPVTRDRSIYPS